MNLGDSQWKRCPDFDHVLFWQLQFESQWRLKAQTELEESKIIMDKLKGDLAEVNSSLAEKTRCLDSSQKHSSLLDEELKAKDRLLVAKDDLYINLVSEREALTWLLDEIRALVVPLDLDQRREQISYAAQDTITTMSNLVEKFKHLQNEHRPSRRRDAKILYTEKISPGKLHSERKNRAKYLASSLIDSESDELDSNNGSPRESQTSIVSSSSRGSRSATCSHTFLKENKGHGVHSKLTALLPGHNACTHVEPALNLKIPTTDQPSVKQAQGFIFELNRVFRMLQVGIANDLDYYQEICRLANGLDQDLDHILEADIEQGKHV